jgi:hypothetical protein
MITCYIFSEIKMRLPCTAADTLDKVVPRELQENAAVMAVLAYTLANLPQNLERPAPKPAR